ncbi:MAG: hypothetical protein IPL84_15665 [Chitinophagaceae bacterium]|nr:hypothetical protein [Chitinophagaceae bacterium]
MKYCYLLVLVCLGFGTMAQLPTASEIKKLKIKKITRQNAENNTPAGKTEWYYNSNGDDTATYHYGNRYNTKTIEYDDRQRIKTETEFSDEGAERSTTVYTYNPDESFTAVNTDKQYKLKNTYVYDKKGREIANTIPDGSVRHSEYNAKGQLIKYYAEAKNGGIAINNTYTYNNKGKLVSQVNKGDYPSSTIYEYDAKGLLKKITITEGDETKGTEETVYLYEYGY